MNSYEEWTEIESEQFKQLLSEYMTNPFNCVNLQVSSIVTAGIPHVGLQNMARILSGYLGSTLAECIVNAEDREHVLEFIQDLCDEMKQHVEVPLGDDETN